MPSSETSLTHALFIYVYFSNTWGFPRNLSSIESWFNSIVIWEHIFFWQNWGLNSASCLVGRQSITSATPSVLFYYMLGMFWDRVSWASCLSWLWTAILLISVYQVARITGMSYHHQVWEPILNDFNTSAFKMGFMPLM
jgi:hypothetical protein